MAENMKKLTVILNSSASEPTKDAIIAASGASDGAAEIIRNNDGKVVAVNLTLAESVSGSAVTAINANSGVANVVTGDVIPGTIGFDGTVADLNTLLATAGWNDATANLSTVDNADGTTTFSNSGAGFWSWAITNFASPLPASPTEIDIEFKIKYDTVIGAQSSLYRGTVNFANGTYLGGMGIFEEGGTKKSLVMFKDNFATPANRTVIVSQVDEAMHEYILRLTPNGTLKAFVDGTPTGATLAATANPTSNFIIFGASGEDSGYTLDYFRHTQPR